MTVELIFVRHGTTDSNNHGLLHGRTDIPLTDAGIEQARRVARRVAEMGRVDTLYSSPLQRALNTAREIERVTGVQPTIDSDLSEFDFGDMEGFSFEELQHSHPELYLAMIEPASHDRAFPNGESLSTFHQRVIRALEAILSRREQQRVVVVAHLIVIATAVAHLTTGDPHDVVRFLVRNCSITTLRLDTRRAAEVQTLDDVTHLT